MKNRKSVDKDDTGLYIYSEGSHYCSKLDLTKMEKKLMDIYRRDCEVKPKKQKLQKPFVCLDTSVVIALAWITHYQQETDEEYNTASNVDKLKKLHQLIKEGKVIAIVTPSVIQELYSGLKKHGSGNFDYIKDNNICVLNLPKTEDIYYFENAEKVALRYCGRTRSPYDKEPQRGRIPEEAVFHMNRKKKIKRPTSDARIMVEASLLGVPLLTENVYHFIFDNKNIAISDINRKLKLGQNLMPMTPNKFVDFYEKNAQFPNDKSRYKKYIENANNVEL